MHLSKNMNYLKKTQNRKINKIKSNLTNLKKINYKNKNNLIKFNQNLVNLKTSLNRKL